MNEDPGGKKERFVVRESPLTDALKQHVPRSTSGLYSAVQYLLLVTTGVHYYFNWKVFRADMNFLLNALSPIHALLLNELVGVVAIACLLPGIRMRLQSPNPTSTTVFQMDVAVVSLVLLVVPYQIKSHYGSHYVFNVILIATQVRFLLKLISFLVENSEEAKDLPTLKSLMYFLFAPTLIYQHSYPRSPHPTNWGRVVENLLQIAFGLWLAMLIMNRQLIPLTQEVGTGGVITADLMYRIAIWSGLFGGCIFFGMGFFFCNCWFNVWAEVLRFGGRQFHNNWSTARDGLEQMPMWNSDVQNWVLCYGYLPCISWTSSRRMTFCLLIFSSSLVHDYVLSSALEVFFPFYTMVSLIRGGTWVRNLERSNSELGGNSFTGRIIAHMLGVIVIVLEKGARMSCPSALESGVGDYFHFRSFSCLSFDWSGISTI